ncbi:MAG: methyltransferase domain-containing protein [Metallibacterium sp.]
MKCPICAKRSSLFAQRDGVDYFECSDCGSLSADADFLQDVEHGKVKNYGDEYWHAELIAARERSFGSSIARLAELFYYARIPITRFIDIGSGPGYLLDSLSTLLPELHDMFYAVELSPPVIAYRTKHENFVVGSLGDVQQRFSIGTCIEVIEHLTPAILDKLAAQMAQRSVAGAVYYIGSGQPEYVKNEDPQYLDPLGRGHVVSYSVKALRHIFEPYGFTVIPMFGRAWSVLIEYKSTSPVRNAEDLQSRIWSPVKTNISLLKSCAFGDLLATVGLESARCYTEHAMCDERTSWAQSLSNMIVSTR